MPGCADFEIAIDMRAHGALGDAEREALERHLSSCDRCRGYEAEARETERLMQAAASEALGQVDWGWVRRYVRRSRFRVATSTLAVAALAVATVWSLLHLPADPSAARRIALLAVVVAFIYGRFSSYLGRAWRVVRLREGGELIASIREEQQERARAIRVGTAFLAAMLVGFGWAAAFGDERLRSGRLVSVVLLVATLVYVWTVDRRRLARERGELDGATRRRQP